MDAGISVDVVCVDLEGRAALAGVGWGGTSTLQVNNFPRWLYSTKPENTKVLNQIKYRSLVWSIPKKAKVV